LSNFLTNSHLYWVLIALLGSKSYSRHHHSSVFERLIGLALKVFLAHPKSLSFNEGLDASFPQYPFYELPLFVPSTPAVESSVKSFSIIDQNSDKDAYAEWMFITYSAFQKHWWRFGS